MRLILERELDVYTTEHGLITEWTEVRAKNSWVDVLAVPTVASYDPESDQAIREVPFVETTSVLSEFVKGVVVGSSGTWSSFSGELAISLVPILGAWPDVRDTISKL